MYVYLYLQKLNIAILHYSRVNFIVEATNASQSFPIIELKKKK